jgi:hypothetical protein
VSTAAFLAALLGVGVLAGIVSTVASLASVVSYPALLALGLPPVSANVTNTVALMFTAVGAAAGGGAGAALLLAGTAFRIAALRRLARSRSAKAGDHGPASSRWRCTSGTSAPQAAS